MNRNWDIFRTAANGADPTRGTSRFDEPVQRQDRRNDESEYIFDSPQHGPRRDWEEDRDEGYGWGARARTARLHGPTDERLHGGEHRGWIPSYGSRGYGQGYYARDDRLLSHLYENEHDMRFDRAQQARFDEEQRHPSLWQRVKGAFTGKGPKNWVRSDERIREDVCERLADHPHIDASDIEVVVKDGEVTLVGLVDHRRTKRLAEDVTEEVRGIRDIHNQIKVRS